MNTCQNALFAASTTQLDPERLSRWRVGDHHLRYALFWDAGLLVLLVAALMIAGGRKRFSVRAMLIATTLVAVLLGIICCAVRS